MSERETLPAIETDPLLWPLLILAGTFPLLMAGFLVSVIANRLIFLGWALGAVAAYFVVLRQGFVWVWHPARHLGAILLLMAAAVGVFGWLVARDAEAFDEGFRGLLYDVYEPWMTAPRTAWLVAAGLGALGLAGLGIGAWRESRRLVLDARSAAGDGAPADSPSRPHEEGSV